MNVSVLIASYNVFMTAAEREDQPLVHVVRLPLGDALVTLDRRGLALDARGGFEARWADDAEKQTHSAIQPEAYRAIVKEHLNAVYRTLRQRDAPTVSLNLASHQLVDDLIGWSKLNASSHPPASQD
jgi:hypothetical protein